ncbi:MAG: F0F1 ATP synthase subunit A [Candidatus Omnitrophica bacterium]|nr:F0F1 ATP synthase subunit A [Candidatus Omnitrophota bacterium]
MADGTTDGALPELPNIVGITAGFFKGTAFARFILRWEDVIFSLMVIGLILLLVRLGSRRLAHVPGRLQSFLELFVGGFDEFVRGILGPQARKFTPFLGTLFLYILAMNLIGMIPFMKSATSSWSMTMALALCVFVYVQYTAIRGMGIVGYIDHLAGKPRGVMAIIFVFPVFMLFMHIITELIKPFSLSLRLRSNIWGDEMLVSVLAGYGLPAVPVLFFNMFLLLIAAVVQALVFCLLATVYFALVLEHDE